VKLKTKSILAGIGIVLILTIISGFLIFPVYQSDEAEYQRDETEIPQVSQSETLLEVEQLYLDVGSKHIPTSAIEVFNRYNMQVGLTQEEIEQITPLEDFFIMGSSIPEDIDTLAGNPNGYKLSIIGEVEKPVTLSYVDILTKFETKHMVTELYCMPSLTGVGKFSGPSLYDIISYANPIDDNVKVIFIAADGYEKGWSKEFQLSEIKSHKDDFLLAVAMNGHPLAIEHGYPVRLALASKVGAFWVKWLNKMVIVPEEAKREEYTMQLTDDINETGIMWIQRLYKRNVGRVDAYAKPHVHIN
jgi:DMSO/TMAO reductase YedYZ molybdopterin-dependent catalytic subunit